MLEHFGPEAPHQLNTYACQVEDALLEALNHQVTQANLIAHQRQYIQEVQSVLEAAADERAKMRHLLTDPQALSDYTLQFFGENGPHPVQTPGDQARAALQQGMVSAEGPLVPFQVNPGFEQPVARPQLPMPQATGGGEVTPQAFWDAFSNVSATSPRDAWRLLATAPVTALKAKVFAGEG